MDPFDIGKLCETIDKAVATLATEMQATRLTATNAMSQVVGEVELLGRRVDRLIALLERLDGAALTLDLGEKK